MYIYYFLLGLLLVLLLFGDTRSKESPYLSPEKKALLSYEKWPRWREVEPAESRHRILCINPDYVPFVNAGSEICTHVINTHLMKKPYKWDVFVATPGYPKVTYDGVRCFDLYDTRTFLEVVNSCDAIFSHSAYHLPVYQYISKKTGVPIVGWAHTNMYIYRAEKQGSWHPSRLTPQQFTVFNSKSLLKDCKTAPPNSKVFIPIVDYREYVIEEKQKETKYVVLSNVNPNKGGALLVQLAKAMPDIEFLGVQGGYGKQVVDSSLPNLRYIPHTNRIKDVYKQAWAVIMPSAQETWGRTAVEAMSSGIPVVANPTPGLRECCAAAAIYVPRDDLRGWIDALRRLKDDRKYYNTRAKLAMERSRALDPRPVAKQIENWLEATVIPAKRPGHPLSAAEKNLLFR
jgi:glycosyltransferase involved in cell wall biosynthesis